MSSSIKKIFAMQFPWQTQDPFLFCAHHHDFYPKGNSNMGPHKDELVGRNIGNDFNIKDGWRMYHGQTIPGFPHHPHRGFETVTIATTGFVDHTDSLGAAGRFGQGDVQWMTAGKGVQHSEMFPLINKNRENTLEIFQIWLNLPAKNKMVEPHFKMLWHEDVPIVMEKGAKIRVVAGAFKNQSALTPAPDSWAANPENNVAIWTIEIDKNTELTLPLASAEANRTLYFYDGSTVEIDGQQLKKYTAVELYANKETHIKNGDSKGYFLMLQGKPLNEPVAKYGPFVMNTEQEIQQAFLDYQETQFGGWPWSKTEYVHPREKGRFALHADGKEEVRN